MRRIKITSPLLAKAQKFSSVLFDKTRLDNFEKPKVRLEKLYKSRFLNHHPKYKEYVLKIITEYSRILVADPQDMEQLIREFELLVPSNRVDKEFKNKKFYEYVVTALRYEDLREKEFPNYLRESMAIKACVYCNSQSTHVIEKKYYDKKKRKVKEVLAKLQLDHFYPKSKYPFLATSFFNLYPCCANCNLAKGNKTSLFQLYTTNDDLDVFSFQINNLSIIKYLNSGDLNDIDVSFNSVDKLLIENHNELFQIQAVYDEYKDLGEELILKAQANPKKYKQMLVRQLPKLFQDESVINRLLIGNYGKPDEVHKRSMSKYTQDIARELGII